MPNSATLVQALGAAFCAILCALSSLGGGGMMVGARTAAWVKSPDQYKDIAFRVVIPDDMVGAECLIFESGTSTKDSVGYVDWGDGYREEHINTSRSWRNKYFYHTYSARGEYVIRCLPNQLWSMAIGSTGPYNTPFRNCIVDFLKIDPSEECSLDYLAATSSSLVTIPRIIGESGNLRSLKQAFLRCTSLKATPPVFGEGVTDLHSCFESSTIAGTIPAFPSTVTALEQVFYACLGVVGNIPPWPTACVNARQSYYHTSLTGTWIDWPGDFSLLTPEQIEELMPSRITEHTNAVGWNSDDFRRFFYASWGGLQPNPA